MLQVDVSLTEGALPWTDDQVALFRAVLEAHALSALRGNISHQVIALAATGSGDYCKAMAAGLNSLGGLHAPLADTFDLLDMEDPWTVARLLLDRGERIPGWGSDFHKGKPDPIWEPVYLALNASNMDLAFAINAVTKVLHEYGKYIFPNPSAYTAAAGLSLGFNRQTVGFLLVYGRLPAWTQAFHSIYTKGA